MANLGLLGALGGLGKGIADTGRDIMARREAALEQARKDAEYQRRLADSRQDTVAKQEFDIQKTSAVEDRRDARTAAQLGARAAEKAADRNFRADEGKTRFERDKTLVQLRATLSRDNSKYSAELKDKLSQDDVVRVEYGAPDATGYAEVIAVTKDGKMRPTGQKVYKPKLSYAPKDEDEDEEEEL